MMKRISNLITGMITMVLMSLRLPVMWYRSL